MKEILSKLKNTDNSRRSLVYTLAFMLLFWTIYDCIVTYVAPLLISENGFSNSMMGLIIGSSSAAGALFDFLLCRIFKRSDFRRIFLIMLAACFLYPLILWSAKTFWVFIVAMVAWGLYYDLYGFGVFDFISRYTKKSDYSANFGVVQVFRSIGAVLAPLFVGLVMFEGTVGTKPLVLSWIFLSIATIFFISLIIQAKKAGPIIKTETPQRKEAWLSELKIWRRLGTKFFPLLLATFYLFFVESFFWTLAPLYAEMSDLKQFGGLFLAAFNLPALLLGWFVGSFTRRLGKTKTAFWGILLGSLILASFHFFSSSLLVVAVTFVASCFLGLSFPAINSIYADLISERPKQETDIEGLEDFSFNLSYFFGPLLAGVLADFFSISWAFTFLGSFGVLIALFLWFSAYRKKKK